MPATLPEYDIAVRWTVQDVINWLQSDKNFSDFKRPFRDAGVDGRKFCKLTDGDFSNMKNCPPKKKIRDLLNCLSVYRGRGNTPPPDIGNVIKGRRGQIQPDSDSESDFFDDDFDDDEDWDDLPPEPDSPPRVPASNSRRKLPEPDLPPDIPVRPPPRPPDSIPIDDYEDPIPKAAAPPVPTLPPVPRSNKNTPKNINNHSTTERRPPPPPPDSMTSPTFPERPKKKHSPRYDNSLNQTAPPQTEDLSICEWYHGPMSRETSKTLLEHYRQDGMFLVRDSTRNPDQPFTLTVYCNNRVSNLAIKKRGNQYMAGCARSTFSSLKEMVMFFRSNTLVLANKDEVCLRRPLPKS